MLCWEVADLTCCCCATGPQVRTAQPRTPTCDTLHDVFINIRDDEGEHVKTMAACQDFSIMADLEVRRETERRI